MKAAVVTQPGTPPIWCNFAQPIADTDEIVIDVVASALSQLTRSRASGSHYSMNTSSGFIAGVDGVGWAPDGKPVYFVLPSPPYGAMAEHVPVRQTQVIAVPESLDPVQAAAMANPGMSSWAALVERAGIRTGQTVLINGATGASGSLAVRIARHLGAGRVIATGRNETALAALDADDIVVLDDAEDELDARLAPLFSQGVDIVLDYLWGPSARSILIAAARHGAKKQRMCFIQIGTVSAPEIALPGAVLRSSAIELMGSGIGSVATDRLLASIEGVFKAAAAHNWTVPVCAMPMPAVNAAWTADSRARIVLTL